MKWIVLPVAEMSPFKIFRMRGLSVVNYRYGTPMSPLRYVRTYIARDEWKWQAAFDCR